MEPERDERQIERLRVLKMREEGKITSEESAELLEALAEPPIRVPCKPSRAPQGVAALGAVLVLIGFFLPWVSIDLNIATGISSGQIDPSLSRKIILPVIDPGLSSEGDSIFKKEYKSRALPVKRLKGGELSYGMGWMTLIFALGAALNFKWRPSLFLMVLGLVMIVYLALNNLGGASSWGLGLIVVFLGYLIELISVLHEFFHPTVIECT